MFSKPSFLAGAISIAVASVAYLYLGTKTADRTPVNEITVPSDTIVESNPSSDVQEKKPDDANSILVDTMPKPPQKKIKSRDLEMEAEKLPQPSQENDLERRIYASLESVRLTGLLVTVREGGVRISGQLLREDDRIAVLERIKSITDWDVDDGLVFRPDQWLAYRTLNQTYVYSEPSHSSPRIAFVGSQYRVWVTEIRDKWVKIESKKGARPGYVRRELVVPEGREQ